jgi:hypothetical protein
MLWIPNNKKKILAKLIVLDMQTHSRKIQAGFYTNYCINFKHSVSQTD